MRYEEGGSGFLGVDLALESTDIYKWSRHKLLPNPLLILAVIHVRNASSESYSRANRITSFACYHSFPTRLLGKGTVYVRTDVVRRNVAFLL